MMENKGNSLYSVVIPVYNSEASLAGVCGRIKKVFEGLSKRYEIILFDDGSKDRSWEEMKKLNREDANIKIIGLMRNFGEHNAVMTGLNHAGGDFSIIMDDDGQNPPEEIPKLINKVNEGFDVVFGSYHAKKHNFFRNMGSVFNDRMATILLKKPRDLYLCSFKIINRALIDEIIKYTGPYPYIDGLVFRSTRSIGVVEVEHKERSQGGSGYTLKKLISLWLNMFTNFSVLPLRISIIIGIIFALFGFAMTIYFIAEKIMYPNAPMGWASTIVAIFIFAGIQLIILGMIGEYLGRLFLSINKTPQFIIREKKGFKHDD